MRVCAEQKPEYFEFISQTLDEYFSYENGDRVLTNLSNDGRVIAVVAYSHFTHYACMMSVASDGSSNWLSREYLHWMFWFVFMQLGKLRVTAIVSESNDRSLNLIRKIGFVEEGRIRQFFGEHDGILNGMLRNECRYLKGNLL